MALKWKILLVFVVLVIIAAIFISLIKVMKLLGVVIFAAICFYGIKSLISKVKSKFIK